MRAGGGGTTLPGTPTRDRSAVGGPERTVVPFGGGKLFSLAMARTSLAAALSFVSVSRFLALSSFSFAFASFFSARTFSPFTAVSPPHGVKRPFSSWQGFQSPSKNAGVPLTWAKITVASAIVRSTQAAGTRASANRASA